MIYGARLIGEKLLKTEIAKEFREMYQKLSNPENDSDLLQKFFYLNNGLSLQFDGFICLFTNLENEKPTEVKQIKGFEEFIYKKCAPLSLISNLIIFCLNNYIIGDEVHNIIETPYDNFLDKSNAKYEFKLKNAFEKLLNDTNNDIFSSAISLRDDFFNSKLFNSYINALKTDGDIRKYEIDIQALFYIIKQIIYQIIRDGQIKFIDEDNIINFNRSKSLEGNFFKIKYQPSNNLNHEIDARDIIEIIHEDKKELGFVRSMNLNFTQEKGIIINIEGDILSKNGLDINSPTNNGINKFLSTIKHWYIIDPDYIGLE